MKNRFIESFRFSILVPICLLFALGARAQKSAYVLVSAPFLIEQKTAVPGHTLAPGSYSIRVVDRLKDRFILRVDNTEGEALATFIGLHNPEFDPIANTSPQGPIFWSSAPKGETAVRGFSFPNGSTLEFVYPKGEAVTLAKLNTNSVPAIDPESEGRKPDPKLSPEDREVVTLWMLSSTRVGPKDETPAIAAKRFVAAPESTNTNAAPVQLASATPPPPLPVPVARPVRPAPVRVAKAEPAVAPRVHSSVKRLPQTASELPLTLLLCLLLLASAATVRVIRTRA